MAEGFDYGDAHSQTLEEQELEEETAAAHLYHPEILTDPDNAGWFNREVQCLAEEMMENLNGPNAE